MDDQSTADSGDTGLRRREFLERTAHAAGLAGLASLPAGTLLAEAAKVQAQSSGMPSPRNMPLDHVVIIMMENRSFDHYFGWMSDVADADNSRTYVDPQGRPKSTIHFSKLPGHADHQGCGHPDPGHGWDSGRAQLRNGFVARGSGNDIFALTYYDEGDLGFIHGAAKAYTSYDRYHCSLLASTWPNRFYKWSAQSGGRKTNGPKLETLGNDWETIFDLALHNNPLSLPLPNALTARYYNSDLPFSAVWGVRGLTWTRPLVQYYLDCALGTLPNISIVEPPLGDGSGLDGLSADEHPHGDVRLGQAWMADVVRAFVSSKCYRRGALFVIYDEWGGFFDHAEPPRVADNLASRNLDNDFGQMGFRVPAVCISPWTRNRTGRTSRVDHGLYGHESILKLITYRFGLRTLRFRGSRPNLRHKHARNIGLSFDWDHPDYSQPRLPDPRWVAAKPCGLGGGDLIDKESAQAHERDLRKLRRMAERHGFPIGDGKLHELFTQPDGILRALEQGGLGLPGSGR